jgi:hypothetical protein
MFASQNKWNVRPDYLASDVTGLDAQPSFSLMRFAPEMYYIYSAGGDIRWNQTVDCRSFYADPCAFVIRILLPGKKSVPSRKWNFSERRFLNLSSFQYSDIWNHISLEHVTRFFDILRDLDVFRNL